MVIIEVDRRNSHLLNVITVKVLVILQEIVNRKKVRDMEKAKDKVMDKEIEMDKDKELDVIIVKNSVILPGIVKKVPKVRNVIIAKDMVISPRNVLTISDFN